MVQWKEFGSRSVTAGGGAGPHSTGGSVPQQIRILKGNSRDIKLYDNYYKKHHVNREGAGNVKELREKGGTGDKAQVERVELSSFDGLIDKLCSAEPWNQF